MADDHFHAALSSNSTWANRHAKKHPDFFPKLASGQAPKILWLGCSDSRVPETTIMDYPPGSIFVHRNIANILTPTDISSSSVIEYAVKHLGVKHVVVCGHTGCGGAAAAMSGKEIGGVMDVWLAPLRDLVRVHEAEMNALGSDAEKSKLLVDLNVKKSVDVVKGNRIVEVAMKERGLKVHGVVFDITCGKLTELTC